MDEDEAALLAELRAISAKSSTSRFHEEEDDAVVKGGETTVADLETRESNQAGNVDIQSSEDTNTDRVREAPASLSHGKTITSLENKLQPNDQVDSISSFATQSSPSSKGGVLKTDESAELLAELRAISSKSNSTSRFSGESEKTESSDKEPLKSPKLSENSIEPNAAPAEKRPDSLPPWRRLASKEKENSLPPWKQKKKKVPTDSIVDVVVSAPSHANNEERADVSIAEPSLAQATRAGFRSSSNFVGERGGAAEDAELLAELRAISSKSTGSNSFVSDDTAVHNDINETRQSFPQKPGKRESSGPEWKHTESTDGPVNAVTETPSPPLPGNLKSPTDGFQSSLPSSLPGEREGAAEDAELLAELRAISSKSSSNNRFVGKDETITPSVGDTRLPGHSTDQESKLGPESEESIIPCLKDKSDEPENNPPSPPQDSMGMLKSAKPSNTFTGNRGGPAEDAELLAELRAISAKSGSNDRFMSMNTSESPEDERETKMSESLSADNSTKRDESSLPRLNHSEKTIGNSSEEDCVASLAATPPSYFTGTNRGAAQDAELSEELRMISAKSANGDRFAGDDTEENTESKAPRKKIAEISEERLPPWKRGKMKNSEAVDVDVVVASPRQTKSDKGEVGLLPSQGRKSGDQAGFATADQLESPLNTSKTNGFNSSLPSTFSGDRGGPAEDDELLAELRAVSAKSNSSSRFNDHNERVGDDGKHANSADNMSLQPMQKNQSLVSMTSSVPPWKRVQRNEPRRTGIDVVVAAPPKTPPTEHVDPSPPTKLTQEVGDHTGGFKSSLPSTFRGDRGGTAEDAELLAELRAISSNSNSSNRFEIGDATSNGTDFVSTKNATIPPKATVQREIEGAAKDAELLSKLKTVSSNEGESRFDKIESIPHNKSTPPDTSSDPPTLASRPLTTSSPPPMYAPSGGDEEMLVSRENLSDSVTDKNWKTRKQAYDLLSSILKELVDGKEATGSFDAGDVMKGVDGLVPGMLADSNASALDSALEFAYIYADYCEGAASADQAAAIMVSLMRGSAFSSSRPKTTNLAGSLTLKLMEVGRDGVTSVHSVTDVLLEKGLTSRKPKVVLATVTLLLDAANKYGAGSLPFAAIASCAPKMLSHSNVKVRETAMKIVAEICRAMGSKKPLEDVISKLKKAQASQLDSLLQSQPNPNPVEVTLRSKLHSQTSPDAGVDVLAAFSVGAKEMEAKRLASRPAINIFQELPKTDYSTRIKLPKWSEKVGALDTLLQCGGEKPYKLVQPSSSVSYAPMISDMKKLLSHTHFAVCSKAMEVLSMLANGVGERVFPYLRPLLPTLLQLSKDKKLTRSVASCLDAFFGKVLSFEHLLEKDGALPSNLDERSQKNALVRSSTLAYLQRCVNREESAGPRGCLTAEMSTRIAVLCCKKVGDSDANVRKASTDVLQALTSSNKPSVVGAVDMVLEDELKSKHPRAYKSLIGSHPKAAKSGKSNTDSREASRIEKNAHSMDESVGTSKTLSTTRKQTKASETIVPSGRTVNDPNKEQSPLNSANVDDALSVVAGLDIPGWGASEDDDGVLACLKSSKWLSRQKSIKALAGFCTSDAMLTMPGKIPSESILIVVKDNTKGFKESNINITKAIFELFLALCGAHERRREPFSGVGFDDGCTIAVEKMSDRKLASLAASLLTSLVVVNNTESVLQQAIGIMQKIKSPLTHESLLKWCRQMSLDFGAASIGKVMNDAVPWIIKECESTNLKVRTAALALAGELHAQIGPAFKALCLSMSPNASSVKTQLEETFKKCPYDSSLAQVDRPKHCIRAQIQTPSESGSHKASHPLQFDVPETDLSNELPSGCIAKMGSKEGKSAWKARKEAMEEVEAALTKCNGMIVTSNLKPLVDLLRALKERMSDSQSNLKPMASKIIGLILSASDKASQAKLGKIVYGSLIGAVINDNRKVMRDTSLDALKVGCHLSALEGGGPNKFSLETLIAALVSELSESELKGGGIPDVLCFVGGVSAFLPNLEKITSARAQSLGNKFAIVIVKCLTSSKRETRMAAELLLKSCLENGVISVGSVLKGTEKLLPAQKRSVAPVVERIQSATNSEQETCSDNNEIVNEIQLAGFKSRSLSSPRSPSGNSHMNRTTHGEFRTTRRDEAQTVGDVKSAQGEGGHPLRATSQKSFSSDKESRLGSREMNWPGYPEEPNSASHLKQLKKIWTPLLPHSTVAALFPSNGIRKQEDSEPGCQILSEAIEVEHNEKQSTIVGQLDLILRWITIGLCSRENTVGMQSLLSLLLALFRLLCDQRYVLSVAEATVILPYLFEKAGTAKGRFRDIFVDIISLVHADGLFPPSNLGPTICVLVIERSHHSKSRVLAYNECRECVQKLGLTGIGKRGVIVTAKRLSEEAVPESKAAAFALMLAVLAHMNGDSRRLAKICGPSNLSDKSKKELEERYKKYQHEGGASAASRNTIDKSGKLSNFPPLTTRQSPSAMSRSAEKGTEPSPVNNTKIMQFGNELPSLQLKLGGARDREARPKKVDELSAEGPFSFSFQPTNGSVSRQEENTISSSKVLTDRKGESELPLTTKEVEFGGSPETQIGAAASLRARLLQIRDKNKLSDISIRRKMESQEAAGLRRSTHHDRPKARSYADAIESIKLLLLKPTPLDEDDLLILDCVSALRGFHSSLSNPSEDGMMPFETDATRTEINRNLSETIEHVTSLISYSSQCQQISINAGMSVSLLSHALLTLHAIFRNEDLSSKVSQESLILLLRETGGILLDPRLASKPKESDMLKLEESKCAELVRAINKLMLTASTSTRRHIAFPALMGLKLQLLSTDQDTSGDDLIFNKRLSRVVSKIFSRVLRAEENLIEPFNRSSVDMGALLCSIEDFLSAIRLSVGESHDETDDTLIECTIMARTLITSILTSTATSGGADSIRMMLSQLGIDPNTSEIGFLFNSCQQELRMKRYETDTTPVTSDSADVAKLVSSFGSATDDIERKTSLEALRAYREANGTEEISAHLDLGDVSSRFRAYVLDQISESTSAPNNPSGAQRELESQHSLSMSERIRRLKSKINAGDALTQSGPIEEANPSPSPNRHASAETTVVRKSQEGSVSPSTPGSRRSSNLPKPGFSNVRKRLAAAQSNRLKEDPGVARKLTYNERNSQAAALRARLEAFKHQDND